MVTSRVKMADEFIGESPVMKMLKMEINLVADADLAALIQGEPGVGKAFVAKLIHQASKRASQAMVTVNCTEIPDDLLESELFGYETGDIVNAGKCDFADGGCLFLDEIGVLPLDIQSKLLRVMQCGEFRRPGSNKLCKVNVRLITATNRNLEEEVRAGRFRDDFYRRLNLYPLHVPSLKQRSSDIHPLADLFMTKLQRRYGIYQLGLSDDAQWALQHYDWPGNVAELNSILSTSALKALKRHGRNEPIITIRPVDLNLTVPEQATAVDGNINGNGLTPLDNEINIQLKDATENFQRRYIIQMLREQNNNLSASARELGLDRSNFHRLCKRLGIDRGSISISSD